MRLHPILPLLMLLLTSTALAANEVEVLRARRELTGLSGTGSGGSIERALVRVDVRVKNVGYVKEVLVRWSHDDWRTQADARAWWVESFSDGTERWQTVIDLGTVGRNVMAGGGRADMGPAFVKITAGLRGAGGEWWTEGRDLACGVLAPVAQPMPQARTAPRVVRSGDDVLLVGGQEREGYRFTIPDVLRLDGRTGAWERIVAIPPLPAGGAANGPTMSPTILTGHEVALVGRKLVLVGGTGIHVGTRNLSTMVLDLDTRAWRVGAQVPAFLHDRRPVVRGAEMHLVPTSRTRPAGDTDRAFIYDAARDAWTTSAVTGLDLAAGTGYVACAFDGGLALLGGRAGAASLRDVLVYDPATRAITRRGSLPADLLGQEPACGLGGQVLVANVEADLGRGTADALLVDPLAAGVTRLGRGRLLPWRATLAQGPTTRVVPSGASGPVRAIDTALVFPGDVSRVDVWAPFQRAYAPGESRTVIKVARDVGAGHRLTLRGSDSPLSWWRGMEGRFVDGAWVFETTELLAPEMSWKPLVDDRTWLPGADLRARRGETTTLTWSW